MREIKFRTWDFQVKQMFAVKQIHIDIMNSKKHHKTRVYMQYTGLNDRNGSGLTEVYEGDMISIDGTLKGNIYEDNKEPTDIVIPQLGTKAWTNAYKEAMVRGYDYSE